MDQKKWRHRNRAKHVADHELAEQKLSVDVANGVRVVLNEINDRADEN